MSTLEFSRTGKTITLKDKAGAPVHSWQAANNVASDSKGIWPDGTYRFSRADAHTHDEGPESSYGSFGIVIFEVPHRSGMGVHSGRANDADGRGRKGPEHCSMGCVRTTDEAMKAIQAFHRSDPIASITLA
jgi:hypothetical protein